MSRTILLTSGGMLMKEEIFKLVLKPEKDVKLAHIITAAKVAQDQPWKTIDNDIIKSLECAVEEVDIEGKAEDELLSILHDKDIIYVQGGEPFYLLKHIRLSGFDTVVRALLDKGVVYVGHSAGTYVACPTLEMALWHRPNRERYGVEDITGMNLVPMIVSVHYTEERKEANLRGIATSKYQVKILNDEQALLFQDETWTFVGKGPEIKL
jgi:dipeptidase E